VIFPFGGVPAVTSGSIPEQSFAITAQQVSWLFAGFLYMNVHDNTFGGGEIRGQLLLVRNRAQPHCSDWELGQLRCKQFGSGRSDYKAEIDSAKNAICKRTHLRAPRCGYGGALYFLLAIS
jgi:hypothetical protein